MTDDEILVIEWLNDIVDDPENYRNCYSDSEQKGLAETALQMLAPIVRINGGVKILPCEEGKA